ncbi:MAG: hypothetical protein F4138_03195 [Acidimicrobiia bacterium]|nr:hypothetical protein [Acidimicrobiia bacterium]MYG93986.1 hypothetical protein [Acidimicrobiia bacterium]MYH98896.1 hypothetical protein [Acidimicrobiia bacterium]
MEVSLRVGDKRRTLGRIVLTELDPLVLKPELAVGLDDESVNTGVHREGAVSEQQVSLLSKAPSSVKFCGEDCRNFGFDV